MERTFQKSITAGDGGSVAVDVYGDAGSPGLLVVPGVMSDAWGWRHVARATTAWPSVSVVNRRGRAPSSPLGDSYSIRTEVDDLKAVIEQLGEPQDIFGWSYGGRVALLLASERPVEHVIAYEPVAPGFGADALPSLREAEELGDRGRSVEIVNRQVSGFSAEHVENLRADRDAWATLCRLSEPLYTELGALTRAQLPETLGSQAGVIDLIIGEDNVGAAPYGTSFEQVRSRTRDAEVHRLPGQGHLAHIDAPEALGRLLDSLVRVGKAQPETLI
ncbi:alpha/beta fold hydrolase [Nocardioides sp. NPDC057772]|uniref:alpha/beta fold hydrolase n=1 Tax=Nocardioides sp. NPDC057772 TaxID=3346245 RepID=UPI00366B592B